MQPLRQNGFHTHTHVHIMEDLVGQKNLGQNQGVALCGRVASRRGGPRRAPSTGRSARVGGVGAQGAGDGTHTLQPGGADLQAQRAQQGGQAGVAGAGLSVKGLDGGAAAGAGQAAGLGVRNLLDLGLRGSAAAVQGVDLLQEVPAVCARGVRGGC